MSVIRIAALTLIGISAGVLPPVGSPSRAEAADASHESPFACNVAALDPAARRKHFDELGPALRSEILRVRELADGYELDFPSDAATYQKVTEWTAGERLCCPFFDIDVRSAREGGAITLRLTGREGVKKFIEVDGGAWIKR